MTQEEAINRLKRMAFKSHPLNTTNDCVDLDSVIELVEELFEQNCIKHVVSGKRPLTPDTVALSETERGCLHCGLTIHQAACASGAVDKTVSEGVSDEYAKGWQDAMIEVERQGLNKLRG